MVIVILQFWFWLVCSFTHTKVWLLPNVYWSTFFYAVSKDRDETGGKGCQTPSLGLGERWHLRIQRQCHVCMLHVHSGKGETKEAFWKCEVQPKFYEMREAEGEPDVPCPILGESSSPFIIPLISAQFVSPPKHQIWSTHDKASNKQRDHNDTLGLPQLS